MLLTLIALCYKAKRKVWIALMVYGRGECKQMEIGVFALTSWQRQRLQCFQGQ